MVKKTKTKRPLFTQREAGVKRIKCAFCKGAGKDPFQLLSKLSTCQVCRGKGEVELKAPITKCPFCKGTGAQPYTTSRLHCSCCRGKGFVTKIEPSQTCPVCKGDGIEPRSRKTFGRMPCHKCKGMGVISKK